MSLSHWSDADRYPRSLHQLWLSLLIAAGVLREVQRCGVDSGVKAVCRFLLRKEKKSLSDVLDSVWGQGECTRAVLSIFIRTIRSLEGDKDPVW